MAKLPNNKSRSIAVNGVGYKSRILAFFGFGNFSVQIIVGPPIATGGGSRTTTGPFWRKYEPNDGRIVRSVTFRITYGERTWYKQAYINIDSVNRMIEIKGMINKIINSMSIRVTKIKRVFSKIRRID